MFRCYFVENGRISWGNDLETSTLAEAIELAQNLRQAALKSDKSPGIEIWQGASLLFQDVHDADQIQDCAPIISPFDTPESTIYATWRPSQARPLRAPVKSFARSRPAARRTRTG
jgi:hypothetical protein